MPRSDTSPLVSVIIPTYNRSELLQLAIESVLAQTYPAIQLIVVDDGSSDDTPAMLAQYAGRIVNVRKANQGGTAARNTGIQFAHGEYLNFMDHDDLMMPTKIERQMEIMHAKPEVGLENEIRITALFIDVLRRIVTAGDLPHLAEHSFDLIAHNISVLGHQWAFRGWYLTRHYTIEGYIKFQTDFILGMAAGKKQ